MKTKYIILVLVLLLMVGAVHGAVLTTSQFGAFAQNSSGYVDGNPIGGGKGYSDIKTSGDCTATSTSELTACLVGVTAGQVVYIPGTASINLTGISHTVIPAGVTLASNRGSGGSAGGLIYRNTVSNEFTTATLANTSTLYADGDNVRITGLRLQGPNTTPAALTALDRRAGIVIANNKGFVVDNCEIYGWADGAYLNEWSNPAYVTEGLGTPEIGSTIANIHHNYIHNNQEGNTGYGVHVDGSQVLIKGNVFDYNRHSITSGGSAGEGYETSYNIDLGNTYGGVFDVHGACSSGSLIAGDLFKIKYNTKLGNIGTGVQIRAKPRVSSAIYNNQFGNCTTQCYSAISPPYPSVNQADGVGNMTMNNNVIEGAFYANGTIWYITPGWASC